MKGRCDLTQLYAGQYERRTTPIMTTTKEQAKQRHKQEETACYEAGKKTHASKLANSEFAIIWYISSAIDKIDHLKSQRHILSRPLEIERTRKRTSKNILTHNPSHSHICTISSFRESECLCFGFTT